MNEVAFLYMRQFGIILDEEQSSV